LRKASVKLENPHDKVKVWLSVFRADASKFRVNTGNLRQDEQNIQNYLGISEQHLPLI